MNMTASLLKVIELWKVLIWIQLGVENVGSNSMQLLLEGDVDAKRALVIPLFVVRACSRGVVR